MTVEYSIIIGGETHTIRVEVPGRHGEDDLEDLRSFVISTAYLEHFGYLPRGVINAVE